MPEREIVEDQASVMVAIPHRSTVPLLKAVLPLWRHQTVSPWIMVVDTGSTEKELADLDVLVRQGSINTLIQIEQPDDAVHYCGRIAQACEMAQMYAFGKNIEFLFHTHSDVFPMRRDLLEMYLRICRSDEPVVGYHMSSRDDRSGALRELWRGMVGHTMTMCHCPTLKKHQILWSRKAAEERFGIKTLLKDSWDTEVTFNKSLREAGIKPLFLGFDTNYEKMVDCNHVHCRSYPSQSLFFSESDYAKKSAQWVADEIQSAAAREWAWSH